MSAGSRLQLLDADGEVTREVALVPGDVEIGRAGKDLACAEDEHMADRHALVSVDDGRLQLRDTGEGSGVWIRIDGLEGRPLVAGDQVWLGLQVVVVRRDEKGWVLRHHGPDGRLCGVHSVPPSGLFLGRTSDLPLDVRDGRLSRRHAQIVVEGDGLRLYDRGAHNGTWVRITTDEPIDVGSEFRLAAHRFRVAAGSGEVPSDAAQAADGTEAAGALDAPETRDPQEAPEALDAPEALLETDPSPSPEPGATGDTPTHDASARPSGSVRGLAARLRKLATPSPQTPSPPAPSAAAEAPILVVLDGESGSVSVEARPGMTILEAVREAGLERGEPVDWECGDGGCGVCVLGVVEGADRLDPPDPSTGEMKTIQITEQVVPDPDRYRLACLARVRGAVRLRKLT